MLGSAKEKERKREYLQVNSIVKGKFIYINTSKYKAYTLPRKSLASLPDLVGEHPGLRAIASFDEHNSYPMNPYQRFAFYPTRVKLNFFFKKGSSSRRKKGK